jgi:hypothetical protein
MLYKLTCMLTLAVCFAVSGIERSPALAGEDLRLQVSTASQTQSYTVIYWNVRFPHNQHVYGTYGNYATALRVAEFVNSFPEYRAVIR